MPLQDPLHKPNLAIWAASPSAHRTRYTSTFDGHLLQYLDEINSLLLEIISKGIKDLCTFKRSIATFPENKLALLCFSTSLGYYVDLALRLQSSKPSHDAQLTEAEINVAVLKLISPESTLQLRAYNSLYQNYLPKTIPPTTTINLLVLYHVQV